MAKSIITQNPPITQTEYSGIKFTPEEMAWITADAKPNEIAYLDNCVIDFLERELAKNKARRRWLEAQEETDV